MRIIGQIPHPVCRMQVFQNDGKFSVKIETGQYEQTFKLREHREIEGFAQIEQLIDKPFIDSVLRNFQVMNTAINDAFERHFPHSEDIFLDEEII